MFQNRILLPMDARKTASSPHLLIVEDEANIRELVHSQLESEGYECVAAADGRYALEALTRQTFDVIVLDLMLPGKDGLTLCREIRNHGRNRNVPIRIPSSLTSLTNVTVSPALTLRCLTS